MAATITFWMMLPTEYRVNESSDYEAYYSPVAHQLVAGRGLTTPDGAAALRTPPGYPLIVAAALSVGIAIGATEDSILKLLTLACIGVSSLFLYLIARDLWPGWRALLPSAAWSTYPLALWLTKQPNTEIPFTTLLYASTFTLWKLTRAEKPRAAVALLVGALAGAAMLIRPIALFLPLVLAALSWCLSAAWPRRQRALTAAMIIAASALTIAPWEVHASQSDGRFVLLGNAGVQAVRDGLTFGVNEKKSYRRGIYVPDAIRTVMISLYSQRSQLGSYGAIARAGARELGQHPVGAVGLVGMKLLRAWYGTDSQRLDEYILLLQLAYLAAFTWAARIAWRAGGIRRQLLLIVTLLIAYFWFMSAMVLPLVRYLVPAIGLAFLLTPLSTEKPLSQRA